jgi:hypothetical protein
LSRTRKLEIHVDVYGVTQDLNEPHAEWRQRNPKTCGG